MGCGFESQRTPEEAVGEDGRVTVLWPMNRLFKTRASTIDNPSTAIISTFFLFMYFETFSFTV
jgi:hypothetical protein